MKSTLLKQTVAAVFDEALNTALGDVSVVASDAETLVGLISVLDSESPPVRLLADSDTLKHVMDDFLVASKAANHVESGILDIRSYDNWANSVCITDDSVMAIVRGNDSVAGLTVDDEMFVDTVNGRFSEVWNSSETYTLRTPSLNRVRETLISELGESTATDFDSVLSSIEAARSSGDGLDEVEISILVAAKNEKLLYDLSRWGEDVGIASKATFSRTKTRMEDAGIIETEKVPIDVGRPRLRLQFGDDQLLEATSDELESIAKSMLEE